MFSSRCGTHYRRIEELVNVPQPPGRAQQLHTAEGNPPKRKAVVLDDVELSSSAKVEHEDETFQYRRIRLRSQKVIPASSSRVTSSRVPSAITNPASTIVPLDISNEHQTPGEPSHEYQRFKQQTRLPTGSIANPRSERIKPGWLYFHWL